MTLDRGRAHPVLLEFHGVAARDKLKLMHGILLRVDRVIAVLGQMTHNHRLYPVTHTKSTHAWPRAHSTLVSPTTNLRVDRNATFCASCIHQASERQLIEVARCTMRPYRRAHRRQRTARVEVKLANDSFKLMRMRAPCTS